MNHGRIEQVGTPSAIYNEPASRFVADFIGTSNLIDGVVVAASLARLFCVPPPEGNSPRLAALLPGPRARFACGPRRSISLPATHLARARPPWNAPCASVA
jgi:hypothetical protein